MRGGVAAVSAYPTWRVHVELEIDNAKPLSAVMGGRQVGGEHRVGCRSPLAAVAQARRSARR